MAKGLLKVKGVLEWDQLWPTRGSDADTIHVKLDPSGFQFTPNPKTRPLRATKVFDEALVRGSRQTKPPITKGKVTVRLQGIDAPELHFAALLPRNGGPPLRHNGTKFRQFFGETSTVQLRSSNSRKLVVPCEVVSMVDKPNEVFDTYGRLIGDVIIRHNGKRVNLNQWLVANGWAYPSYYNSMLPKEIKTLRSKSHAAKKKGISPHLADEVGLLDQTLVYRHKGKPNAKADQGRVLMPKLFRRFVRYTVARLDHQKLGTFRNYLAKQKDAWVPVTKFLKNPDVKPAKNQRSLATIVNEKEAIMKGPGDLVFFEMPSTLIHARTRQKLTRWW